MTSRRTFLNRPFWRNYVIGYLLIGAGVILIDILASQRKPLAMIVPATLFTVGFGIFFAAVGWSLWTTLRRANDPPP